ncbi:hypothetical protein TNIN_286102 [Trichonephila inaurata madagascariensis]|uniref:Uncharacterized protein n=1 Tax=Trichonephila inaurata madagascariensis TaxID=2747483 RepID=A0A8X6WXS0_9ARAC|nr:hypothetical protein TNIN_286102 [Trichonephila inaurata madagascariensis]
MGGGLPRSTGFCSREKMGTKIFKRRHGNRSSRFRNQEDEAPQNKRDFTKNQEDEVSQNKRNYTRYHKRDNNAVESSEEEEREKDDRRKVPSSGMFHRKDEDTSKTLEDLSQELLAYQRAKSINHQRFVQKELTSRSSNKVSSPKKLENTPPKSVTPPIPPFLNLPMEVDSVSEPVKTTKKIIIPGICDSSNSNPASVESEQIEMQSNFLGVIATKEVEEKEVPPPKERRRWDVQQPLYQTGICDMRLPDVIPLPGEVDEETKKSLFFLW